MTNPTIEKLIEHENAIAELYALYSQKLEKFRSFWEKFSREEEDHALWIKTLYSKSEAGLVSNLDRKFPLDSIDASIKYINSKIAETKEKDIQILEALESAVHLENAMLEHKFFEVFPDDELEMKIVLDALRLSTANHYKRIHLMWLKESGQTETKKEAE